MNSPAVILVSLLLLTACSSTPNADKPPRYGKSVQVTLFDHTQRPINPKFEIFAREIDVPHPFKIIAICSRNAKPQDEGLMMTAIAWRAKQLGADALLIQPPSSGGWNNTDVGRFGIGGSGEHLPRLCDHLHQPNNPIKSPRVSPTNSASTKLL